MVEIVKAMPSHQADAQLLIDEYYREADVLHQDTPEALRKTLSDPQAACWIAYVNGDPAGCVVLRPLPVIASAAECKRLYVRSRYRRRGLAAALMDALEGHAGQQVLDWIYLDSKDDLQAAIAMYRERGYQPCERYNDNTQATVFLRKALSSN